MSARNHLISKNLPSADIDVGEWLAGDMIAFHEKANAIWQSALAADEDHPFRLKYGLSEGPIWVYGEPGFVNGELIQNSVVVPYYSGSPKEITALRFIRTNEDGEEHDIWLRHDPEHIGAYARIGEHKTDTVLLTSSFSEGLSLFEATGHRVAVPESSADIGTVAATLANAYPDIRIVVCGTEDTRAEAEAAARMIGASLAVPALNTASVGESFNSLYQQSGAETLREIVNAAAVPKSDPETDDTPLDIAPWPFAVDIQELVSDVESMIRRFSVLTEFQVLAVALWIFFSHVTDLMPFAPILGLFSPVKRCGKTTLLSVLAMLVRRPLTAANMTAAYMSDVIKHHEPTIVIDEGDTFLAKSSELTGIINAGHSRTNAFVRKMGSGGKRRSLPAFCAKVLAMIGHPADTTYDRCIPIHLRRMRSDETVEELHHANKAEFAQLKSKIARWALDNKAAIRRAHPPRLRVQNSRTADNWVPLLTIASLGGEELLKRAITAAEGIAASAGAQLSDAELLLRDIKTIFDSTGRTWFWTQELVDALCADEEKCWSHCDGGKPLSSRSLAEMLAPFDISSKDIRHGEKVRKGYTKSAFADAFARYVTDGSNH